MQNFNETIDLALPDGHFIIVKTNTITKESSVVTFLGTTFFPHKLSADLVLMSLQEGHKAKDGAVISDDGISYNYMLKCEKLTLSLWPNIKATSTYGSYILVHGTRY